MIESKLNHELMSIVLRVMVSSSFIPGGIAPDGLYLLVPRRRVEYVYIPGEFALFEMRYYDLLCQRGSGVRTAPKDGAPAV